MRQVLLVSSEQATVSAVVSAMEPNGGLDKQNILASLDDLAARLEHGPAPAVLVDIDHDPKPTLIAIGSLSRRFASTRFIAVSAVLEAELLLLAMRCGVQNFLPKQTIAQDLKEVLSRVISSPQIQQKEGAMVAVLAAGGGCGATTFAVNLGYELALLSGDTPAAPSLIVDLDCCYGAVASYMGLDGAYGIMDLLNRDGPVDADLISSTALSPLPEAHALINTEPSRLGQTVSWDERRLGQILKTCKSVYRWTIVDAPRLPMACAAEIVRQSDAVFLLAQLTIKDLRVARQMLGALSRSGAGGAVRVLIGRYAKRRQLIALPEAREALGLAAGQPLGLLNNDYAAASKAVNFGKPLAEVARMSVLRRDIKALAAELSKAGRVSEVAGPAAMRPARA